MRTAGEPHPFHTGLTTKGDLLMPTKREQFVQTIRAQYLGHRMRQLREQHGLTLKYVAEYLGVEFSTLARYERAEWPFRKDHVVALLDVYRIHDDRLRGDLVTLADGAWRVNHWYRDQAGAAQEEDRPFPDRWWIQSRAATVHGYSPMLVPELLQTPEYAQTVIRHSLPPSAAEYAIDNAMQARLHHQRVLSGPSPTGLVAVIEESILHRPVGSPEVVRGQLEHLRQSARVPHIEIRVLPTSAGLHPGVFGAFTLYQMRESYPQVACVEHLGGCLVIEAATARRYVDAYDRLREAALSESESVALIETRIKELT